MTENMRAYRLMYENADVGAEFDKPTREMACEWINTQIEYYEKLNQLQREYIFPLVYGGLSSKRGEFDNEIVCDIYMTPFVLNGQNPTLTIYTGIEKLAEIMGERLFKCYYGNEYHYCYWFRYGKYIINQIEKSELFGVKCEKRDYR